MAFICDECQTRFSRGTNLKRHNLSQHAQLTQQAPALLAHHAQLTPAQLAQLTQLTQQAPAQLAQLAPAQLSPALTLSEVDPPVPEKEKEVAASILLLSGPTMFNKYGNY